MSLPHVVAGQELTDTLWNNLTDQVNALGSITPIFDVVWGRGQAGDPAANAVSVDSNTVLGASIPTSSYRMLRMVFTGTWNGTTGVTMSFCQINNDSGANYACQGFYTQTTTGYIASASQAQCQLGYIADTSGSAFNSVVDTLFPNPNALANKIVLSDFGCVLGTSGAVGKIASGQANNNPITRIRWFVGSPSGPVSGSRLTLWGIS